MPRGRLHVPSTHREGIWFSHRGADDGGSMDRREATSTGQMLSAAFRAQSSLGPAPPPERFHWKSDVNYRTTNRFSLYDNRNVLQNQGEYFEDGRDQRLLGKRIYAAEQRLHSTDKEFLKHFDRDPIDRDYTTSQRLTYEGRAVTTGPRYRRFPKHHEESTPGPTKLTTTTCDWFKSPDVPHKTPFQVLATSLEPFTAHNSWKYSYSGPTRIYPSYKRCDPLPDPVFNKYGSNFSSRKPVC